MPFLITLCLLILANVGFGQEALPEPRAGQCAKITFAGIDITCLNQGVGSLTARERADIIQRRVSNLAGDATFDPATLQVANHERTADVLARDIPIVSLYDGDTSETSRFGRQKAAEMISQAIDRAIRRERE